MSTKKIKFYRKNISKKPQKRKCACGMELNLHKTSDKVTLLVGTQKGAGAMAGWVER